jgi:hypothetical protein
VLRGAFGHHRQPRFRRRESSIRNPGRNF